MENIYENKSLRFIINAINANLVQFENPDQIVIASEAKKDIIVKMIEIDMSEYLKVMIKNDNFLKNKVKNFETTTYDFIVFCPVIDDEGNSILMCNSLLELTSVGTSIDNNAWSLDKEEWNLFLK